MIYVIGIGVEGKDGLSKRALDIIGRARLIAGGRRHLEEFAGIKARRLPITGGLDRVFGAIGRAASKGGVAVLATGDPLLFGIGDALIKRFGKKRITVIPNVSVVQEAFARIKESANGVKVLSVHGRGEGVKGIVAEAAHNEKLAVFTDTKNSPAVIARALIGAGLDGFTAYVCEDIGSRQERVTKGSLKSIATKRRFAPLNVLILVKDKKTGKAVDGARRFGIQDGLFSHSSNMITKEELRVIALSKLDIKDDSVIWDVGAGSGSVSVEAGRLCPMGRVFAVEKNSARVAQIKKNKNAFKTNNVEVISGTAPACLRPLPSPDAVFVGGGGAGLESILDSVAGRLLPGGRVVVSAITMESGGEALGFFKKNKWPHEAALISVTKVKGLGERSFLSAANPVFIISAAKPGSRQA